jgi:hypothetical protein
VSRALCPSASTTWSRTQLSPDASVTPRIWPSSISTSAHALLEADLAAQRLDVGAHLLDHADEAEGADVRLADEEDLLGAPALTNSVSTLRVRWRGSLIWL